MGLQINFFADEKDAVTIAETVLRWAGEAVVFPQFFSGDDEAPKRLESAEDFLRLGPQTIWFLCKAEDICRVNIVTRSDGVRTLRVRENPVVEYSPSSMIEPETVKIGRFYVSYPDQGMRRDATRLFGRLKRRAHCLPAPPFWIFPSAQRRARWLRMRGGPDIPNPNRVAED